MGTTPTYAIPYQDDNDPPDGPALGEALAVAVEAELARIDADVAGVAADLATATASRRYIEKTSNTNRNNTAALADDPHLLFSLAASSTYVFKAVLFVTTAASNTPDIDFGFTFPSGCTASWSAIGPATNSTTPTLTSVGINAWNETTTSGASVQRGVITGAGSMILVEGRIKVGATPGNLRLQWAQDIATAENTTLQAGSFMQIEKVA